MVEYPFTAFDVINLLNLHTKNSNFSNKNDIYVNCPFCNDTKGKLNIHLQRGVFRCNRCNKSGNLITLYADLCGVSNKQAYKNICESISYKILPEIIYNKINSFETIPCASLEIKHKTYTEMLSLLTLSNEDKNNLVNRGLSENQIQECQYKSTPSYNKNLWIASKLLDRGCILKGVAGFYQTESGQWTANFSQFCKGILIPILTVSGKIQGLQIRLNHKFKDGTKYIWFSSGNKNKGISSESPIHFIGNPSDKVIYLTEGALKASVAYYLSGKRKTFLAVAGVNQYKRLGETLSILKKNGLKYIVESYDMDKFTNEHVANACKDSLKLIYQLGFEPYSLIWNINYKGIDDFLYEFIKSGSNSLNQFCTIHIKWNKYVGNYQYIKQILESKEILKLLDLEKKAKFEAVSFFLKK